jgi:hypothetical protein
VTENSRALSRMALLGATNADDVVHVACLLQR